MATKEPDSGDIKEDFWRILYTQEVWHLQQILRSGYLTEKQVSIAALRMHKLQEILFGGT